jgi:hypothetical protein
MDTKMAKTIIEEMLEGLSPDVKAAVQANVAAKPHLAVKDRQMAELFTIYMNEEPAAAAVEPAKAAAEPVVPKVEPNIPTVPVHASATASPAADPNAIANNPILAKLAELNTTVTSQLEALKNNMVTKTDVPEFERRILTLTLRTGIDLNKVMSKHQAEFGESLDDAAFQKFVTEQAAAGVKFLSDPIDKQGGKSGLEKAHDQWVNDRRTAAQIQKGISEGLKVKTSGQQVPGQTQATAMSPAQQVLAKAREGAKGGAGSNALAAAERMAAMVRQRDEGSAGAVN